MASAGLLEITYNGLNPIASSTILGYVPFMIEKDDDTDSFYAFRGQWLDHLNTRHDLTHADFRVAYFIASKINPDDRSMWWGVFTIADELPVSIATITAATDKLADKGLLVITKRAKGAYRYSMRMPIDPAGDAFRAQYTAERKRRKKTGGRVARVSKNETG